MTLQDKPTLYFIGVTTSKSSINKVFPLWMEVMGHPEVKLMGIDHAIHDDPLAYRASVTQIKRDPNALGALVTTHKLDLFKAAQAMFDYLDPYALITDEISCISKRAGNLRGHAKDPITSGLSLNAIIGSSYFADTGAEVLCLGAGGAALSTLLHLLDRRADKPKVFTAIDVRADRLEHMKAVAGKFETDMTLNYVLSTNPKANDKLMSSLPEASLIINATGMGKDSPGSPITDQAIFPTESIVWEFNYRGELDFYHQAKRQEKSQKLSVHDGWVYFLHGWSQVITEVLDIKMTPELFRKLDVAASSVR